MSFLRELVDRFLHLDKFLEKVIPTYGSSIYLILFAIVFCETGLVVTPFLPGDSLLFAAGSCAAKGWLDVTTTFVVLAAAAIAGDTVNYWAGKFIGPRAFTDNIRFLKKKHLQRTHEFYEKYGGLTIILARFIPIIRTFAPFVAGIGAMNYRRFLIYNVVGGLAWVALCVFAGYFFGRIPWVEKNFSLVVLAIVIISVLPLAFEVLRARLHK